MAQPRKLESLKELEAKREKRVRVKRIKMDLNYPKRELGKDGTRQGATFNVIAAAVYAKYGEEHGPRMDAGRSKMWAKIQDRMLDDDGKPVRGTVELSEEQFDFVHETVDSAVYHPAFATAATVLMEHLDVAAVEGVEE